MPNIGHYDGPSSTKLFADYKKVLLQSVAASCAAASMAASCVAFFWFCRMEKRFRHRLIIILIFGDMMKATWFFIFATVSIARGTIYTESALCQASGFLIQYGTETSDYAVLVIAVHSAMQVFRPSKTIRSDGLYPYRRHLFAGAILVPTIMSSLAFAGAHQGYMSQGAFCSLPIRPFWYRLALTWIPRYIIAITILVLAVAIYVHIGFEFRSLSEMMLSDKPTASTTTPMLSTNDVESSTNGVPDVSGYTFSPARRGSSIVSMISAPRRTSVTAAASMYSENNDNTTSASLPSGPQSPRRSSAHTIPPSQREILSQVDTTTSGKQSNAQTGTSDGQPNLLPTTTSSYPTQNSTQRRLAQQRARIHRQLRLMFVYPIVYIFVWLVPFVNHCMMYYDDYAAHPSYGLTLASTVCVAFMGVVDSLIFTLRERPWRHIPSSDGTFLGSFACWRATLSQTSPSTSNAADLASSTPSRRPTDTLHRTITEVSPTTPNASASWLGGPGRIVGSVVGKGKQTWRNSGVSDQAKIQSGLARMRLEAEMEERRVANANANTNANTGNSGSGDGDTHSEGA